MQILHGNERGFIAAITYEGKKYQLSSKLLDYQGAASSCENKDDDSSQIALFSPALLGPVLDRLMTTMRYDKSVNATSGVWARYEHEGLVSETLINFREFSSLHCDRKKL